MSSRQACKMHCSVKGTLFTVSGTLFTVNGICLFIGFSMVCFMEALHRKSNIMNSFFLVVAIQLQKYA